MPAACSRPQPPTRGESPGVPGAHPTRRQLAHTTPTRPRPCKTTGLPSTRDPRAPHRTIPICQIDPSAPIPVTTEQISLPRISAGQVWPNLRRGGCRCLATKVQGGRRAGPLRNCAPFCSLAWFAAGLRVGRRGRRRRRGPARVGCQAGTSCRGWSPCSPMGSISSGPREPPRPVLLTAPSRSATLSWTSPIGSAPSGSSSGTAILSSPAHSMMSSPARAYES